MIKETICEKGTINEEFKLNHNLTSKSLPSDFIDLFLPLNKNPYSTLKDPCPLLALLAKWTNLKAVLADAGSNGSCY